MSWLKKSADQKRYEELYEEVTTWEDEEYDPNDPHNEEMERKQAEQVALYYKLHPNERPTFPDGISVNIVSAS
jgi:hypothetical protein